MHVPDVNALVCAHRPDVAQHERYRTWLDGLLNGPSAYGLVDVVLLGFMRIVTNRRIFVDPTSKDDALRFLNTLRARPQAVPIVPGPRHWTIFEEQYRLVGANGADATDAYLAALMIEHGHELVTEDRGFKRFPALRTVKPRPRR